MIYEREWADRRNATGFAAECARLALPFYEGDRKQDLVTAIEIAERYAGGEEIDAAAADAAANAADAAASADYAAYAINAAASADYAAARAARTYATGDSAAVAVAANAATAGVDDHEIQAAFARWVVRDLSCGRGRGAGQGDPRVNYYEREWADRRNAAGFAAECARLALPFYEGDRKQDLVTAIEIAERRAGGEEIDAAVVAAVADAAVDAAAHAAAYAAAYAADAAAYAADAAAHAANAAAHAGYWAGRAGVDDHELQAAFARWTVRDLSCGRELPVLLRQAAGAAVVAGDEALAKEILA